MQVMGQIFIPEVNYLMMVLTVIVVAIFQTTTQLGNAYGKLDKHNRSLRIALGHNLCNAMSAAKHPCCPRMLSEGVNQLLMLRMRDICMQALLSLE